MKKYNLISLLIVAVYVLPAAQAQSTEQVEDQQTVATDQLENSQNLQDLQDLQIRVRKAGSTTVREYQSQGKIYKVEIAPENTPAYILSDQDGNGNLSNSDTSIDSDLVVPQWTIGNW